MNNNQNRNNRNNQNNQNRQVNQNNKNNQNSRNYNNYNKPAPNSYMRPPSQKSRIKYTAPYRYESRRKTSPLIKFGFRFLVFLIFFAIISGVFLSLFFFNLTRTKTPSDIYYTVNTTRIKNNKEEPVSSTFSLSYDIGFANGQYYFPINDPVNDIMGKMEFVSAGDKKSEFSFIRSKSGEYIKFIMNSNITYINEETYHLPGPSFSDSNNIIYVPLEFLQNVFENLNFTFDEKNKNKITLDFGKVEDFCFKIHKTKKIEAADESQAPYYSADPINFKSDLKEYEKYFNPPIE